MHAIKLPGIQGKYFVTFVPYRKFIIYLHTNQYTNYAARP